MRWRLLVDGCASGAWNMGVDEALLAAAEEGRPTLRFYAWKHAWLSLGYGQSLSAERARACRAHRVGVVRRITGGGAVLHGCDLTYSVAAPLELLPGDVRASYARIAEGLAAGLAAMGVEVERVVGGAGRLPSGFDCFANPAADEIRSRGLKLCGSAQRRSRRALLQHGSIRLRPDPPEARRGAGLAAGAATSLRELGGSSCARRVIEALAPALAAALGAHLESGRLTPEERAAARNRGPEPPRAPFLRPQEASKSAR